MDNVSILPKTADQVLIAANPRAGAGGKWDIVERLATLLRRQGFHTEIITDLDVVARRALELADAGRLRALIGAGGDGTIAELVNRTRSNVPITVFPLGTENLLARYLKVDAVPENMLRTIIDGRVAHLDAGRAGARIFLLMISFGFDADVIDRVHRRRSGNITHWSYVKPIVESLRSYRYPELKLRCDTYSAGPEPLANGKPVEVESVTVSARWAYLFNLPCYAGGLSFCPDAVGTDGLLDLCAFRRGSLTDGLRYLGHLLLRRHRGLSDCVSGRYHKIRVESGPTVLYQLDGDPGGQLPVEIDVLPGRLSLVVPQSWLDEQKVPTTDPAAAADYSPALGST